MWWVPLCLDGDLCRDPRSCMLLTFNSYEAVKQAMAGEAGEDLTSQLIYPSMSLSSEVGEREKSGGRSIY